MMGDKCISKVKKRKISAANFSEKKAVPTSEALRLLKQSMKEYRKVYEKLAKR